MQSPFAARSQCQTSCKVERDAAFHIVLFFSFHFDPHFGSFGSRWTAVLIGTAHAPFRAVRYLISFPPPYQSPRNTAVRMYTLHISCSPPLLSLGVVHPSSTLSLFHILESHHCALSCLVLGSFLSVDVDPSLPLTPLHAFLQYALN
eukprot:2407730-Rhodomonas_salina.1